jgi:hypothetical protein
MCVLAHWCGRQSDRGPAEFLFAGGVRTRVSDEASFAQARVAREDSRGRREETRVGIVESSRTEPNRMAIRIFTFCGHTLQEKWIYKADTDVTAFALSDDAYVSCNGNQYFLFKFSTETRIRLDHSPLQHPYTTPLSAGMFVLVYKDFVMTAGTSNEKGSIVRYDRSQYGQPLRVLAVPDVVYLFFETNFLRVTVRSSEPVEPIGFEIPQVKCAAMADDSLLVVTPTVAKIVGSIPAGEEIAQGILDVGFEDFDEIVARLSKDAAAEAALSVFCELWKQGHPDQAFELLLKQLVIGNIAAIVALVPLITLFGTPSPPLGLAPRPANEKVHLKRLTDALAFQRSQYLNETIDAFTQEMPILDTAYAQCLAIQCIDLAHTRELDCVLKAKNLNIPHFSAFLHNEGIRKEFPECAPALAILFSNTEQVDRAMTIWESLDKATMAQKKAARNPLFVTEAAYTVQMSNDPHSLPRYLDWIYECDPVRPRTAITALLSPNHQAAVVEEWLKRKDLSRDEMVLRYHCFIVRQPNKVRSAQHANDVLNQLLDVLADIDDDGFQLERLSFTET